MSYLTVIQCNNYKTFVDIDDIRMSTDQSIVNLFSFLHNFYQREREIATEIKYRLSNKNKKIR